MYKYSYCFNMRLNFPKNERSNQQQQLTSAPISSFSLRGDPRFLPLQLQPFHFNGVSCSIFYQNFNINTEENEMIMISGTKKSDSKDWRDLRRRGMQLFEWDHTGQFFPNTSMYLSLVPIWILERSITLLELFIFLQ